MQNGHRLLLSTSKNGRQWPPKATDEGRASLFVEWLGGFLGLVG